MLAKTFELAGDVAVGSVRSSEQEFVLDELKGSNEAKVRGLGPKLHLEEAVIRAARQGLPFREGLRRNEEVSLLPPHAHLESEPVA